MDEKISRLSTLLAGVGCDSSEDFIRRVVIPIAEARGCSIIDAINDSMDDYDDENEESPHLHELYFALKKIPKKDLEFLI